MFNLYYKKNDNSNLFHNLNTLGFNNIQNYIPLYKKYFDLNCDNYNKINLNNIFNLTDISIEKEKELTLKNSFEKENIETIQNNIFKCTIKSDKTKVNTETFFKYSPLIDPIKYITGKYKDIDDSLLELPKLGENKCHKKVLDINNSAYVDSFFTYLTSKLLHEHKFIHGVDFYGSFLCTKKNFEFDILDDLDFLNDNEYFHKNKNDKFKVVTNNYDIFLESSTRNYRKKINIMDNIKNLSIKSIDNEMYEDLFNENENLNEKLNESLNEKLNENVNDGELIFEYKNISNSKSTHSSCSSRCSSTSNESNDNEEGEYSDEEDSETSESSSYSLDSNTNCIVIIKEFPIQIIALEKLHRTLDSLLYEDMPISEWSSCLFQIIMILITYQKLFNLTHNDLHTNNIMFNETDKEFIIYKYNNKYYKVPTYGRLFKIIDFGRAIYKFKNKVICSDSFHHNGDAATQYNCEPYFNKNKPRLEPNLSFDLCRLGCSLYDYFKDTLEEKFDSDPVAQLINTWCKDDKGKNILYKKCGEERYPDFKLYKMIARTVNDKAPENFIDNSLFSNFLSSKKQSGKRKIINIDELNPYYTS
jgi:hypothetical protein